MADVQKLGSIKRFGTRYGKTVKERLAKIEVEQKKKHKCPYCHFFKVKQINVGIWQCGKCNAKFTGKAYTLGKKITKMSVEEQAVIKEDKEEE